MRRQAHVSVVEANDAISTSGELVDEFGRPFDQLLTGAADEHHRLAVAGSIARVGDADAVGWDGAGLVVRRTWLSGGLSGHARGERRRRAERQPEQERRYDTKWLELHSKQHQSST
jgi:hypothetical protein